MRACLLIAVLLSLASRPAPAQLASADSAAGIAAVRAFDAALAAKDTAAAGQWLGAHYRYFTSTGGVWTRAQLLDLLAAPAYHAERAERSALEARITGGTAVVGSRWQGRGSYAGGTFDDDQRCSLVLTRQGQRWQLVAEHCTQIQAES